MPLLNLALVTQALLRLVEAHVTASPEWPAGTRLTVSPEPPDKLAGDHTIGLYLYHLAEDPHYRNAPSPAGADAPLRHTPMALNLYYQLTARSDLQEGNGPLEEQKLMGLAVKALRDHPVIDDATAIGGTTIFPPALVGRENRLRVVLQPSPPSEAIEYWTAGSQPLRLAAYYQVSVVMLEPEPTAARPGRVLHYGAQTFARTGPRLDGSRSQVRFTVPGETEPRTLELRPAEAAVGGEVVFFGSGLSGDDTRLVLSHRRWPEPIEADAMQWGVTATETAVHATVRDRIGDAVVLPGVYGASVRVVLRRTMPDGTLRDFTQRSNETPFSIAPRIDGISPFAAGRATVTGLTFDPELLPEEAIEVWVGPERLVRVEESAPGAGEFRPVSATELEFCLPAGLPSGATAALRILVDGMESAPRWIVVP